MRTERVATAAPPAAGSRLAWLISDARVIAKRNLLHFIRVPALFVFSIVQPIMFVLLFRYVFGGVITGLPPGVNYVSFLMPGIFVQTSIFGSTNTGIGLAEDMKSGLLDRFRSLPMARSATMIGRTLSDLVRNVVVVALMIVVGYMVGFRFENGFVPAVAAVGLAVLIGFSFSWISATIGLAIRDVESVQAASFTWIFPLTFISSALVPYQGMPWILRVIARNNPVTIWADTVRTLIVGTVKVGSAQFLPPTGETLVGLVLKSTIWIVGILAVFAPLATWRYRDLT